MEPNSAFTQAELDYLSERRLARVATTGRDGTPHVTPVGFSLNRAEGTIDIGGHAVGSAPRSSATSSAAAGPPW